MQSTLFLFCLLLVTISAFEDGHSHLDYERCCHNGTLVMIREGMCAQYNYAPILIDAKGYPSCHHTNPNIIGLPCQSSFDCPSIPGQEQCSYIDVYGIFTCNDPDILQAIFNKVQGASGICLSTIDCLTNQRCIYNEEFGLNLCIDPDISSRPLTSATRCICNIPSVLYPVSSVDECGAGWWGCVERFSSPGNYFCAKCSFILFGICQSYQAPTCSNRGEQCNLQCDLHGST